MIEPTDDDVGRRVAYRDTYMKLKALEPECGEITSLRHGSQGIGVFVRFDGETQSKRCTPGQLDWVSSGEANVANHSTS